MKTNMETTISGYRIHGGYIGIMEKKMETTLEWVIWGLGFRG